MTIAGQWLEAGRYLLQLALDPSRSQCEVGQHGTIPFDISWKMQLLPSAEAKGCSVVPDDSKQRFSQVGLPKQTSSRQVAACCACACGSLGLACLPVKGRWHLHFWQIKPGEAETQTSHNFCATASSSET